MALIGIGFALANYEMNVKAVTTPEDATGIQIGVASVILLLVALIWSGLRVLRIDNTLQGVMIETAKTTSLVFIILLGAAMLTAAFRAFGGEELVRDFLNSLPGGFWSKFVIVMAVIFVLGFFLDFIEIAVVVVPIVAPILLADPSANITAVWLGVMIGLNIQTSFLTPPFGFALFYLRGVAPAVVKTVQMYKGVIAFIGLQLVALVIVGLYPPLVNYLPNRVSLLSETAPPPRNPRLQYCVEEYIHGQFQTRGAELRAAIDGARGLDYSTLPNDIAGDIEGSFEKGEQAMTFLAEAKEAEAAVEEAADPFRPVLKRVRDIQADVREVEAEIAELKTEASRLRGEDTDERKAEIEEEVAALEAERDEIQATIPADWDETYGAFQALGKTETDLRAKFRRAADDAYTAVLETQALLLSTKLFEDLRPDLTAIRGQVEAAEPAEIEETVNELARRVGKVEGTSKIKSALTKARRSLRAKEPDKAAALEEIDKALALYEEQVAWRGAAQAALSEGLGSYETAIRGTLGVRPATQDDPRAGALRDRLHLRSPGPVAELLTLGRGGVGRPFAPTSSVAGRRRRSPGSPRCAPPRPRGADSALRRARRRDPAPPRRRGSPRGVTASRPDRPRGRPRSMRRWPGKESPPAGSPGRRVRVGPSPDSPRSPRPFPPPCRERSAA